MAKKSDDNQPEIVKALRRCGASVHVTSAVGHGFPDIVIGWRGRTYLAEIKDGKKGWKYTTDQTDFYLKWLGRPVVLLESIEDVQLFFNEKPKYIL